MAVGDEAYIDPYDVTVTQKAVFIEKLAPIIPKDAYDDEDAFERFIPIKRTGPGWTEDDFELDFSGLGSGDYEILLETDATYIDFMNDREMYVVFSNFEFKIEDYFIQPENELSLVGNEEDSLESQLAKAIEQEDFLLAARLTEEIKQAGKHSSKARKRKK